MRRVLWVAALVVTATLLLALVALFSARAWFADADPPPEFATGRRAPSVARSRQTMVVSAHPLASEAGREILRNGGRAIDAAIAVQAMLTLVEPQSSGIGGGAFLLHFDAERGELDAFDGREVAPAAATPELFLKPDGSPLNFIQALVGGRSVGVPGVLRMLEDAHRWHGQLEWRVLFEPAIRAAKEGFEVTPRLHRLLRRDPLFRTLPASRALFYPEGGRAKPIGARHRNPALAKALEVIAEGGADAFYEGALAKRIVAAVQDARQPTMWVAGLNKSMLDFGFPFGSGFLASELAPGQLSSDDLARYESKVRKPVCIPYREYRVCGHPPPTSGGVTTLQILGLLDHFDLGSLKPGSVEAAHLLAEAGRLAFADRAQYVGDPDFVKVPVARLLDPDYLRARAGLIDPMQAADTIAAGNVGGLAAFRIPDTSPSLPSTTHFSIVDDRGAWVSMTSSVENAFGSRLVVDGFVLNNQLTDFSFVPERDGRRVANAVAAGKRPRSSMSPLLVFDASGRPVLAVGSAGGSRIIGYTVQTVIGVLDWGLNPQQAVSQPHILCRGGAVELENEGWPEGRLEILKSGLVARGHEVRVRSLNSGLHALSAGPNGGYLAGVDPRREGLGLGD